MYFDTLNNYNTKTNRMIQLFRNHIDKKIQLPQVAVSRMKDIVVVQLK